MLDQEKRREAPFGAEAPEIGRESGWEVGAGLGAARMRAGYELDEVAQALRIRRVYLQAIEEGRFADLPGPAYAVGFLRSYAEFLDLDGDAVARAFKDQARGFDASAKLVFPAPSPEGKRPTAAVLLVSIVAAVAIYGLWHHLSVKERTVIAAVSELPERLAPTLLPSTPPAAITTESPGVAPRGAAFGERTAAVERGPTVPGWEASQGVGGGSTEGAPGAPMVLDSPPVPAAPVGEGTDLAEIAPAAGGMAAVEDSPGARLVPPTLSDPEDVAPPPVAVLVNVVAAQPTPAPPTLSDPEGVAPPPVAVLENVAAAQPMPVPPALSLGSPAPAGLNGYVPQVYGAGNKEARVVLRAWTDSWIQIQGANNELVLTRMLRAGDIYQVPNRTDLVMTTGNAGAIEITVDGKLVPRVGPIGAVRRDISLDADRLLGSDAAGE